MTSLQIANGVVIEGLDVIAQLVGVQWRGLPGWQCGAMTRLTDFAAAGFDQLVKTVVHIATDRIDSLIVEITRT